MIRPLRTTVARVFLFHHCDESQQNSTSWGIWNFHSKLRFSLPQREEKGGATQNDQELGKFRKNKQKISLRSSAWKTLERFDSTMCNRLVHEKIISGKAAASARKERRKRTSGSSGKFVSLLGKILRKLSWLLMEIVITHRKFHIYSQRRLYFPPSTTTTVVHARYRPYITQTAAAQQQHIHMSISVVLKWWFGIFLAKREERERANSAAECSLVWVKSLFLLIPILLSPAAAFSFPSIECCVVSIRGKKGDFWLDSQSSWMWWMLEKWGKKRQVVVKGKKRKTSSSSERWRRRKKISSASFFYVSRLLSPFRGSIMDIF